MAAEETETLRFRYGGVERLVEDAVRKPSADGHELITGREVQRDGRPSDAVKNYRIDRVEGEVEVVTSEGGDRR